MAYTTFVMEYCSLYYRSVCFHFISELMIYVLFVSQDWSEKSCRERKVTMCIMTNTSIPEVGDIQGIMLKYIIYYVYINKTKVLFPQA